MWREEHRLQELGDLSSLEVVVVPVVPNHLRSSQRVVSHQFRDRESIIWNLLQYLRPIWLISLKWISITIRIFIRKHQFNNLRSQSQWSNLWILGVNPPSKRISIRRSHWEMLASTSQQWTSTWDYLSSSSWWSWIDVRKRRSNSLELLTSPKKWRTHPSSRRLLNTWTNKGRIHKRMSYFLRIKPNPRSEKVRIR